MLEIGFPKLRIDAPPSDEVGGDGILALIDIAYACPPGCFVEVGVYKGGSAWHLAKIARRQRRSIHLFDTFTGIPFQGPNDTLEVGKYGDAVLADVKAAIPDAYFYPGIFPSTLPASLREVAFVHVDCDQYDSVKACIEMLWPLMVSGGVMYFDDYSWLDGATKAVDEAFERTQLRPGYFKRVYAVKE